MGYHSKVISGLPKNHCKVITGLPSKSVRFFQDETGGWILRSKWLFVNFGGMHLTFHNTSENVIEAKS